MVLSFRKRWEKNRKMGKIKERWEIERMKLGKGMQN